MLWLPLSFHACFQVSTNGERLFGTHTCPRIPTLALLRQSKQIRTDSVVRSGRLPPELVTLGSKISEMRESSISSSGGSRHRAPSPARQRSGDKARVSHGAESPEGVGDSAKEEQGGGNRRESAGDAQEGDERQGRRHDVGSNASDAERGRLGELAARGVKVPEPGVAPFSGEDQFGARDIEEGAAEVVKPPDDGNDAMLKAWDKKGANRRFLDLIQYRSTLDGCEAEEALRAWLQVPRISEKRKRARQELIDTAVVVSVMGSRIFIFYCRFNHCKFLPIITLWVFT